MARKKKDDHGNDQPSTAVAEPTSPPAEANGDGRKPVFKVGPIPTDRNNAVSAAVWANEVTSGDQTFTVYNVTVEARYRDQSGEWKTARGFRSSQIPALIYCLQRCFEYACQARDPQSAPF